MKISYLNMCVGPKNWDTHTNFIIMAYNITTPQESTDVSPHMLVYEEKMLLPVYIDGKPFRI